MIHSHPRRFGALLIVAALLGGCSASLLPKPAPPPALFTLAADAPSAATAARAQSHDATAPTLIVNNTRAAAGFDTSRIVYVRRAQEIEFFAQSQWVDAPSRMLTPLMTRAIERTGAFRAVVATPAAVSGRFRLDTEIIRLQQDFSRTPSEVRFTLGAVVIDTTTRSVVASREFDARATAASDDAYGGVNAAQKAVNQVLAQLADFCADTVAH